MTGGAVIHRRAPAKINLALAVGPPNPPPPAGDGLHPIVSWFCAVDLFDELTVTRLEADRPSRCAILWAEDAPRRSDIDWPIEKDLAVRAHLGLEDAVGRRLPVQLKLEKRIPVGAGLAGGSSDAAAMLRAVCDLYDLGLREERLVAIARSLGSDVAFFLDDAGREAPRPAIVSGVGDEIERTPDVTVTGGAPASLALIVPDLSCSTPAVYRAFDASGGRAFDGERVRALARGGVVRSGELFNDLADAAGAVEPRLAEWRAVLSTALGAPVHVTGSGAALYVVLEDEAEASLTALREVCAAPGCAVLPVHAIS